LKYAAELQKFQVSGNLSWNDSGNNKAYAAGDVGMTFNGVSIYYFCKSSPDPKLNQIAIDTQHQALPKGLAARSPMSATPMNAMVFKHTKYPNAAKDYLRFMMEADQYGPWLSNCIGYFQDEVLVGGSETGPLRRRHGYAVLRRLQGTGDPGILGGDGELYRGRYVRHGRHRQRDAGERGQTWRPASRSLLQDLIVVPGPGATLVTAGPKRYA
jgi:hypothetical protein